MFKNLKHFLIRIRKPLANEKGALIVYVMGFAAVIGVLTYTMMEYNARLRQDTSNKIKRFTKTDTGIMIEQFATSASGIAQSEALLATETKP